MASSDNLLYPFLWPSVITGKETGSHSETELENRNVDKEDLTTMTYYIIFQHPVALNHHCL
jgi:hypothetical protein